MNNTTPINNTLPPLPARGERGTKVCEIVRLYLSIIDDLSDEQVQVIMEHVRECADCAAAQGSLQQVTHTLAHLPQTAPSVRVDRAVLAAITAHSRGQAVAGMASQRKESANSRDYRRRPSQRGRVNRSWVGITFATALVAALLLALAGTFYFSGNTAFAPQAAFALPPNLTWNGYILYHSETRLDTQGKPYHIVTYYDLATKQTHVETQMDNTLDVVAIGSGNEMLGLDMMHHVAQLNADAWDTDESMFDLTALRHALQARQDVFLDTDLFRGQKVYRIRNSNGLVLLLDMDYMPVNVLRGAVGPGTGQPVYDTFQVMPAAQVASSMWNMNVPTGFKMGTLPAKP